MADADLTYDFGEIPNFVRELDDGADLVMGDRMDNIQPGAMPWLHQHVGNPILSGFLNVLYRTGVRDAHCGMRAIRRSKLEVLDLRTPGMEFASEMVIRAAKRGLDIRQFPIEYHPRGGESKLDTWSDGWRHLRFLLVHSPNHLFLIPGLVMSVLGGLLMLLSLVQLSLIGRVWGIHAEIAGSLLVIVGTQVVSLGLCAHAYGMYFMGEHDPWFERMRARFRLEHGLALGGVDRRRRHRDRGGDRHPVDRPRLRRTRRGAPGDLRRDADHRRDPGLLQLVPAEHPRPAPRSVAGCSAAHSE